MAYSLPMAHLLTSAERVMRLLVANGFAEETAPCTYLPTAVSNEMTRRAAIGVLESL